MTFLTIIVTSILKTWDISMANDILLIAGILLR